MSPRTDSGSHQAPDDVWGELDRALLDASAQVPDDSVIGATAGRMRRAFAAVREVGAAEGVAISERIHRRVSEALEKGGHAGTGAPRVHQEGPALGNQTLQGGVFSRQTLRHRTSQRHSFRAMRATRGAKALFVTLSVAVIFCGALSVTYMWHATRAFVTTPQRYATVAGQRATVHWSTGSTMTLAPATEAHVRGDTVEVDGEAYFDISPRSGRPFIVKTEDVSVRVLGTRFGVRHYATDTASRVVVEEGRVALVAFTPGATSATQIVLSARMLGRVTDSGVVVKHDVPAGDYSAWTRGNLQFKHIPLRDVAAELARAYGVRVRVADSVLAAESLTLHLSVGEQSITRILDLIGEVVGAHHVRQGDTYTLLAGRAQPSAPKSPRPPQIPTLEREYGK